MIDSWNVYFLNISSVFYYNFINISVCSIPWSRQLARLEYWIKKQVKRETQPFRDLKVLSPVWQTSTILYHPSAGHWTSLAANLWPQCDWDMSCVFQNCKWKNDLELFSITSSTRTVICQGDRNGFDFWSFTFEEWGTNTAPHQYDISLPPLFEETQTPGQTL